MSVISLFVFCCVKPLSCCTVIMLWKYLANLDTSVVIICFNVNFVCLMDMPYFQWIFVRFLFWTKDCVSTVNGNSSNLHSVSQALARNWHQLVFVQFRNVQWYLKIQYLLECIVLFSIFSISFIAFSVPFHEWLGIVYLLTDGSKGGSACFFARFTRDNNRRIDIAYTDSTLRLDIVTVMAPFLFANILSSLTTERTVLNRRYFTKC